MNLNISGDPKNLAKIEALAKELGLFVSRELKATNSDFRKIPERLPGKKAVEKAESGGIKGKVKGKVSSIGGGPLYGIE